MRKKRRNFFWDHTKPKKRKPQLRLSRTPPAYRKALQRSARSASGKKALKKFKQFWGVSFAPRIIQEPGHKGKAVFLAGMGNSPGVFLANGPEGRETRRWTVRGRFMAATDPSGRRIFLLRRSGLKRFGQKPKFVGYAYKTDYVPTGAIERAGSHKSNRHWTHSHGRDEHGRWPKVYRDAGGNFIYGRGSYKVTSWIYH